MTTARCTASGPGRPLDQDQGSPQPPLIPMGSPSSPLALPASTITAASFAPFGDVIEPRPDGDPWRPGDAELQFEGGPPRLYLMTLAARGLEVEDLARHQRVSQALGSVDGQPWYLVVARADHPSDRPPDPARDLQAFRIPPRCLVVLRPGTWHAGPLFSTPAEMVFVNLESRTTDDDDVTLLPVPAERHCRVEGAQTRGGLAEAHLPR